jgi:hypothetical protein
MELPLASATVSDGRPERSEISPPDRFPWILFASVVVLSAAYESLFVGFGINPMDEAWPLYAAWGLERGGELYRDVQWVFPPGHLMAAWIGRKLDPPGILVARMVYAAFAVAAVASIFVLASRLMSPRFAWLAAALVAVAAPDSHLMHVIFGYRYLCFSVLALVLFDDWLRTGDGRRLFAAGLLLGLSACFRLEPAFAGALGIGAGVVATAPDLRHAIRNGLIAASGVMLVMAPVALWLSIEVGPAVLWRELVTRPATMLSRQSLPFPRLRLPSDLSDRNGIRFGFAAVQFRTIWFLYAGYCVALVARWVGARREGRRYEHGLLIAVVVWGGSFFVRSATRSDLPHLESVIPPVCLLFAHGISVLWRQMRQWMATARSFARFEWALIGVILVSWIGLQATDMWLPRARRGLHPIHATGAAVHVHTENQADLIDDVVSRLRALAPEATILDLTASPLLYLLSERPGPGRFDIVMPGTFLTHDEELEFLNQVVASPPAAIIWPKKPFDNFEERSLLVTAPRLSRWILGHYRRDGMVRRWSILLPDREKVSAPDTASTGRRSGP